MNITELLEHNKHLITIKLRDFHGEQLKVVKYKRKVFYNNLWTPELELCRGLVLDTNDNIVALPFTKIYNYGSIHNVPASTIDAMTARMLPHEQVMALTRHRLYPNHIHLLS